LNIIILQNNSSGRLPFLIEKLGTPLSDPTRHITTATSKFRESSGIAEFLTAEVGVPQPPFLHASQEFDERVRTFPSATG
jgi:hypothetical protein